MIEKIISGGQTGVDRAALDFALNQHIALGGWCPKGRLAEDGPIPDKYPLREGHSEAYSERTIKNIAESDGTLVITRGLPSGGTAFTLEMAEEMNKPYFHADLLRQPAPDEIHNWLRLHEIKVLNVAGPRASEDPEIASLATTFLSACFAQQLSN